MTSATGLSLSTSPARHVGRRTSQHLRTGDTGLRSPNSIPSSPTSIHSSSSAIFERDIEPILPPSPPSLPGKPLDPHRIPRAKNTEQLDQAVPSVLDSAAAILTSTPMPSSTYPLSPTSFNAPPPQSTSSNPSSNPASNPGFNPSSNHASNPTSNPASPGAAGPPANVSVSAHFSLSQLS
ncbi:hypothetical protein NMY22_g7674 [Coprinellus aureogranulatus]|nr:hypothetical protein NMY22_g7674 [Coprinellus aureogranulatus]